MADEVVLEPGQIWELRAGPGEEPVRATILVVDDQGGPGETVHVALDGVTLPNPVHPERPNTRIGHMPLAGSGLRPDLVALVGHHAGPLDLEGYEYWRTGGGDEFTVGPSTAVGQVDEALRADRDG